MGQFAATNLAMLMSCGERGKLVDYPEQPWNMALSAGYSAIAYHPSSGIIEGESVKNEMFGQDLGLSSEGSHPNPMQAVS